MLKTYLCHRKLDIYGLILQNGFNEDYVMDNLVFANKQTDDTKYLLQKN